MAELNSSAAKTGKHNRKRVSTRVDLTAMVDLAFLLITFFILTTTLSKPKTMDLAMPVHDTPEGPVPASRTMTVCLGKDNKVIYYLGEAAKPIIAPTVISYGKNGIRKVLLETAAYVKKTTGKDMIVLVKPSNTSVYDNLVNTLDELNITKTQRYAIVDIPSADVDLLKKKGVY
ncbi:biopolymer transporter ExbD [Mucilaginibacter gynuensis]|uniref:Biopolymer transporter ExbD n=1 Tax=Mucilaginibacter gynuensis TaxID=1302236 RepID=A0ABP8HC32_9SPHI